MVLCALCGRIVPEDEIFCPGCGTSIPQAERKRPPMRAEVVRAEAVQAEAVQAEVVQAEVVRADPNICAYCGRDLRPGQFFCLYCGRPTPEKLRQRAAGPGK